MFEIFSKPLPAGTPAPPFILPDEKGEVFVLNLNRNKNILLVFYPADDTPGCTKQLCNLRDDLERLKQKNVFVVGVNPGSADSHQAFKKKYSYPFPLLVDSGRRVAKLYKASGIVVKRTVYLIGRDGKIKFSRRGDPSVDEILAAVPAEPQGAKKGELIRHS
jgi:thioredoxin-dependent peroxiredoxin